MVSAQTTIKIRRSASLHSTFLANVLGTPSTTIVRHLSKVPPPEHMEPRSAWRVTAEGVVQSTQMQPVEEIMFGDFLERVFIGRGDEIAIVDTETEQQYTYAEVLSISRSLAAVLQQRGVRPHDLVVLCAMTGVKSCCFILALLFCQATMVATKHFFSVYEFKAVLKNFPSLKLVIADNASASNLRQATSVDVLNLGENWDLGRAPEFQRPGKADPKSSIQLMCLTSGSTGPSKAVCLSHHNMMANLTQWTSPFERYLMCNPISHLSGILCFMMTMANGETMFMASENLKDDTEKYLYLCSKYKLETGLTMPVLFTSLTKYGPTDKLATFQRFYTGGSTIPQPVIDEFRSLHPQIKVQVVFGSSEAGVILQSVNPAKAHSLAVLTNVEAKVVDLETNAVLGPHQNGMLVCKAPSVAMGYYNNEKATKEAFVDGWQITGDLAYRDDDGCFVLVDRLKQMIKCMDSQVAPADLELLIAHDREVLKVVVGGVAHEKFGEAAVAFVVPRKGTDLKELRKRLTADLESKMSFYKRLHGGLFFVATIPETDSGKFSRKDIVAAHLKKEIQYLD